MNQFIIIVHLYAAQSNGSDKGMKPSERTNKMPNVNNGTNNRKTERLCARW